MADTFFSHTQTDGWQDGHGAVGVNAEKTEAWTRKSGNYQTKHASVDNETTGAHVCFETTTNPEARCRTASAFNVSLADSHHYGSDLVNHKHA